MRTRRNGTTLVAAKMSKSTSEMQDSTICSWNHTEERDVPICTDCVGITNLLQGPQTESGPGFEVFLEQKGEKTAQISYVILKSNLLRLTSMREKNINRYIN